MAGSGEEQRVTIRPEFHPAIMIDFQGAKITSDTGFLFLREIDERFGILGPIGSDLEDARSWVHSKHAQLQMVRQRVYQIAAGHEDCNDADFLRIDLALRLAIGKGDEAGASQSIAFECTLERIVTVSEGPDAGNLILGRIQLVHVGDELLENGREVDWHGLDVLGRLSGNRYCAVRSVIESETNWERDNIMLYSDWFSLPLRTSR